jgi:hypothetical protein
VGVLYDAPVFLMLPLVSADATTEFTALASTLVVVAAFPFPTNAALTP